MASLNIKKNDATFIDELTPIAKYIVNEININSRSQYVRKMANLNNYSVSKCLHEFEQQPLWLRFLNVSYTPESCINNHFTSKILALTLWTVKVKQNGDWDHKSKIPKLFHPRDPIEQQWHLYGDMLYYYDVWSNIHYGYVGKAAGFSEAVLLDGAGLEQIGSNLYSHKPIRKDRTEKVFLRSFDDSSDRAGIKIGIKLYMKIRKQIVVEDVIPEVLASTVITKKPYNKSKMSNNH
jgi:hypothetical protein